MKIISILLIAMLLTAAPTDMKITGADIVAVLEELSEQGVEIEDFDLSWDAGDAEVKSESTLFDNIPKETAAQKKNFAVLRQQWGKLGLPAGDDGLTLSWDQARALVGQKPSLIQKYVKSFEDCLYYLCAAGFAGSMSSNENLLVYPGSKQTWTFSPSPVDVLKANTGGRSEMSALISYLLDGDYDEVGEVYVLLNRNDRIYSNVSSYFRVGKTYYSGDLAQAFNGIGTSDFSPSRLSMKKGTDLSRALTDFYTNFGALLICYRPITGDEMMVYNQSGKQLILPSVDKAKYTLAYKASGYSFAFASMTKTDQNTIRGIRSGEIEQDEAYTKLMGVWGRLGLPENSRGLTLTWAEAKALAGQDIEVVREKVKTLEDCLYFYAATGRTQSGGDLQYAPKNEKNNIVWHFNYSPQMVYSYGYGNCGGNAGLVYYLLDGDYDEVGYIGMAREGGGHVTNYLRDGDTYYTFDMNQFCGNISNGLNFHMDKELNPAVIAGFGGHYSAIYTYSGCPGGDSPIGWSRNREDNTQYLIKGYATDVNIVKEDKANGFIYKEVEVSRAVLNMIDATRNVD